MCPAGFLIGSASQLRNVRVTLIYVLSDRCSDGGVKGRDKESDALRALVDRAGVGAGGCLLLLGGPGTGKTALLDLAAAYAAGETPHGFLVLRTQG